MKNFIEIVCILLFVVGVLFVGVGIMGIFMNEYVDTCEQLMLTGDQVQIEILEKVVSYSGGGSSSRNRHEYFRVKYLGLSDDKEFTRIDTALKEFDTYEQGDMISIAYDSSDPDEAIIIKSPEQLKELKFKPFFIVLMGVIMILISLGLGKLLKK